MADLLFGDLSLGTIVLGILLGMLLAVVVPRLMKPSVTGSGEKKQYMDLVSVGQVLFDENKREGITCVHAAQIFKYKVAFSEFAKQFIRIYGGVERFAMRLVHPEDERPYWIAADPSWDPMDNITCVVDPCNRHQFEEIIGKMCSEPIPIDIPLWRLVYIQNFVQDDGSVSSAFVWKYHHGIADGFTAMRHVISHCIPVDESMTIEDVFRHKPKPKSATKPARPSILSILKKTVTGIVKLVFLPKDPVSPCKPNYRLVNGAKRVCSFGGLGEEFTVTEIKRMAAAASNDGKKKSVNDILIAGFSRALGMYCEENKDKKGAVVPSDFLSAMWVALNTGSPFKFEEGEPRWGNSKLGVCYLSLPILIKSPVEQLNIVYNRIRDLIGSPEPIIANRLQALVAGLPYTIGHFIWPRVSDKVTLSVSNLPGPQSALRWPIDRDGDIEEQKKGAGVIQDMLFFVPPVNDIGIMASIISYNDRVNVGVTTAKDWITQEQAGHLINDLVPEAMRELKKALSLSDVEEKEKE